MKDYYFVSENSSPLGQACFVNKDKYRVLNLKLIIIKSI